MVNLTIYQQNLHRSLPPTQQLLVNAGLEYDTQTTKVLCIQEPFTKNNLVSGLGMNLNIHGTRCTEHRTRAAIATNYSNFLNLAQFCTHDCVVICVSWKRTTLYVCNIYLDPTCDFDAAMRNLDSIIKELNGRPLLLVGDINAKHQAWGSHISDERGKKFYDFCCSNHLHILNDGITPTYSRENSESFIDISACTAALFPFITNWHTSESETLSDHKLIITEISDSKVDSVLSSDIYLTRKFKTQNVKWSHFEIAASLCLNNSLDKILQISTENELNYMIQEITECIVTLCNRHLPKLFSSRAKNYWWSSELTVMRKRLLAAQRRYKRCKCAVLKQIYESSYNKLKTLYREAIKTAKINSWKQFCSSVTSRNAWGKLYKLCRKPENFNSTLNTIDTGTGFTTTPLETARALVHAFFPRDIEEEDNNEQADLRREAIIAPDTGDDVAFSLDEVNHIISELDDKKAPGMDAISGNIVKHIHNACPSLLLNIYNMCLKNGVFPNCWKASVIKVIPKNGKKNKYTADCLRPISLLPVLGKVLEKLMINRIMYHLIKNNSLHKNQFGFMPSKSTEDAVYKVVEWMKNVYTCKEFGILISLDISGAFNSEMVAEDITPVKSKRMSEKFL